MTNIIQFHGDEKAISTILKKQSANNGRLEFTVYRCYPISLDDGV